MSPELLEMLSQFGSLGVASGFIGWLFVKAQHRLDTMVETFRSDVDAMQERCDQRVGELRARYDKIIDRYNAERDTLHLGLTQSMKETSEQMKEVSKRLEHVGEEVQTGRAEMRQHYAVLDAQGSKGRK